MLERALELVQLLISAQDVEQSEKDAVKSVVKNHVQNALLTLVKITHVKDILAIHADPIIAEDATEIGSIQMANQLLVQLNSL